MFDQFVPRDTDGDGDMDFISTRGNSSAVPAFKRARQQDSPEVPLPP